MSFASDVQTLTGKTGEAEQALKRSWPWSVSRRIRPRVLRHFATGSTEICLGGRVMHGRAASTAWDWI